jgi:hypothetical protein
MTCLTRHGFLTQIAVVAPVECLSTDVRVPATHIAVLDADDSDSHGATAVHGVSDMATDSYTITSRGFSPNIDLP